MRASCWIFICLIFLLKVPPSWLCANERPCKAKIISEFPKELSKNTTSLKVATLKAIVPRTKVLAETVIPRDLCNSITDDYFVIKDFGPDYPLASLKNEHNILTVLSEKSRFIIRSFGYDNHRLFLEYIVGCDLFKAADAIAFEKNLPVLMKILYYAASALYTCCENNIIHGDVKSPNFLLSPEYPFLKIVDWESVQNTSLPIISYWCSFSPEFVGTTYSRDHPPRYNADLRGFIAMVMDMLILDPIDQIDYGNNKFAVFGMKSYRRYKDNILFKEIDRIRQESVWHGSPPQRPIADLIKDCFSMKESASKEEALKLWQEIKDAFSQNTLSDRDFQDFLRTNRDALLK